MSEFERCWPWLWGAMERNGQTHSKEDLRKMVEEGTAQLHPMPNAAILTTIINYPNGNKDGLFWLAGGDLHQLVKGEPLICKWMKSEGCNWASIRGRKGWTKVFPAYKDMGIILAKELQ